MLIAISKKESDDLFTLSIRLRTIFAPFLQNVLSFSLKPIQIQIFVVPFSPDCVICSHLFSKMFLFQLFIGLFLPLIHQNCGVWPVKKNIAIPFTSTVDTLQSRSTVRLLQLKVAVNQICRNGPLAGVAGAIRTLYKVVPLRCSFFFALSWSGSGREPP